MQVRGVLLITCMQLSRHGISVKEIAFSPRPKNGQRIARWEKKTQAGNKRPRSEIENQLHAIPPPASSPLTNTCGPNARATRWEKKVSASYKFHAGFSGSDSPRDTEPVRVHATHVLHVLLPLPILQSVSFYLKRQIFHATSSSSSSNAPQNPFQKTFSNALRSVNLSNETIPRTMVDTVKDKGGEGKRTVCRGRDNLPRQLSRVIENCTRNVCMLRSSAGIDHLLFTIDIRFATLLVRSRLQGLRFDQKELESPRSVLYGVIRPRKMLIERPTGTF